MLDQARDPSHPLLERVKFLGITGTNLDEFFMIRVATTLKKLREGIEDVAPDGYNTEQQLEAMRARARRMLQRSGRGAGTSCGTLLAARADLVPRAGCSGRREIREYLSSYFSREICPGADAAGVRPGHPFPFISNLSKNFAVVVRHGGRTKFARVKVPDVLPRFIPLPRGAQSAHGGSTFVFLEDVIRANIQELFPGTQVKGAHLFRIVRDADLEIEQDEADDLLETVDRSLQAAPARRHLAAAGRGRHAGARAQHPRRELRGHRRRRRANAGSARVRRLDAADATSPARAEGRAVLAAQRCGAPTRIRK